MCMGGAPAAPDYTGAAEAQGRSSVDAINAQTLANRPNINTPAGSMAWEKNPSTGAWTGNLSLDEKGQQAFDSQRQIQANQQGLAKNLQGQAAETLSQPMDWSKLPQMPNAENARNDAINATYNQMTSRMDPQWDRRQASLQTQLANQGLDPNSEAAHNAMSDFSRDRNDAYGSAMNNSIQQGASAAQQMFGMGLSQRQQGISEGLQQRGQALNEMQAVQNGQQVGMPSMPGFSNAGAAQATNFLGAAQSQGQYGLGAAQLNQQLMGDALQAGGGAASMYFM